MPVKYTKTSQGKEYERKIKEDAARKSIPYTELFTEEFMKAHTPFSSFQEMADQSGAESIQSPEWETFVIQQTKFKNWQEMLYTANAERVKRLLKQ